MKIVTVVGARPQFIKAAVVSQPLRKRHTEILVHTGQHFDYQMSQQFFEELAIPRPDYNLGISGGTHGQMTGRMLMSLEDVLIKENPDWLLVYGDTNSTLAGALAAAKLHIPVCHVEAGVRTQMMESPEEINRICTDHVSALLLASTENSLKEMEKEGLAERAFFVGDPMYDAFEKYKGWVKREELVLDRLDGEKLLVPGTYYYLTCHREENTKKDENLYEILSAMNQLEAPTIYPVHPRNRERAARLKKKHGFEKVLLTEPVGYLESICLVSNAKKIVTDSGGLQREAFFAGKKCVTVLDVVAWPETMAGGRNMPSKPLAEEILEKLETGQKVDGTYMPFGDGRAVEKIVRALGTVNK